MKTGFKDPIAPPASKKLKKNPLNFDAPQYDERSSCFQRAGTDYGVGFNQPVGHSGKTKQRAEVLPFGRPNTMKTDHVHRGQICNLEMPED